MHFILQSPKRFLSHHQAYKNPICGVINDQGYKNKIYQQCLSRFSSRFSHSYSDKLSRFKWDKWKAFQDLGCCNWGGWFEISLSVKTRRMSRFISRDRRHLHSTRISAIKSYYTAHKYRRRNDSHLSWWQQSTWRATSTTTDSFSQRLQGRRQ